jgi:predicted MPP superfamily phosphohydrolase
MFLGFRMQKTTNYLVGFTAFGAMILTSVPGIGFFLFGTIYFFTKNDYFYYIGMTLSSMLFLAIISGIIWGRWNWKIHHVNLVFDHLPATFDGVKIVQISDIHVGSFFNNHKKVEKAIQKINQLDADYVVFTGDLVNNTAAEMNGWIPVFSKINAKKGKYSILGNHDYGDYVKWSSPAAKKENLKNLMKAHELMGWNLMMDENKILEESGEKLALIGVQNIGVGRFPWYGNLEKAHKGTEEASAKLLLSHDPTHWNAEVTKKYHDIDVAFAGHTHGTQFGVKIGGFNWSPAQYVYKQWAGLYEDAGRYLYVNRGFGFHAYPGRVGIMPEITVLTLKKGRPVA